MRPLVLVIGLGMGISPAQSQSLHVSGTAGFLSEWALDADVTQTMSGPGRIFAGPLTWKHVGLCDHRGPEEKQGKIEFQLSGPKASSQIQATFVLEHTICIYRGRLSEGAVGYMNCRNGQAVPIALSVK